MNRIYKNTNNFKNKNPNNNFKKNPNNFKNNTNNFKNKNPNKNFKNNTNNFKNKNPKNFRHKNFKLNQKDFIKKEVENYCKKYYGYFLKNKEKKICFNKERYFITFIKFKIREQKILEKVNFLKKCMTEVVQSIKNNNENYLKIKINDSFEEYKMMIKNGMTNHKGAQLLYYFKNLLKSQNLKLRENKKKLLIAIKKIKKNYNEKKYCDFFYDFAILDKKEEVKK